MSGVNLIEVQESEDGIRLDKWFKSHFPGLPFGKLQKLMRTGQVRLDGGRVKPSTRISFGQKVRVPPISDSPSSGQAYRRRPGVSAKDRDTLEKSVLHIDDEVMVINKPAGLAVQGGSGLTRHLDGMLDALRFGASERPKLVHRLDKDTSGVLVLARSSKSARRLTELFRTRDVRKLYWAMVVGVPEPDDGLIDARLRKVPGPHGERVVIDDREGKRARSRYKVLETAGRRIAWLALEPLTGRTHQLRVHLADILGNPIIGDRKYGGDDAVIDGGGILNKLHLHARAVEFPLSNGKRSSVFAPIADHFGSSAEYLGFSHEDDFDLFLELE